MSDQKEDNKTEIVNKNEVEIENTSDKVEQEHTEPEIDVKEDNEKTDLDDKNEIETPNKDNVEKENTDVDNLKHEQNDLENSKTEATEENIAVDSKSNTSLSKNTEVEVEREDTNVSDIDNIQAETERSKEMSNMSPTLKSSASNNEPASNINKKPQSAGAKLPGGDQRSKKEVVSPTPTSTPRESVSPTKEKSAEEIFSDDEVLQPELTETEPEKVEEDKSIEEVKVVDEPVPVIPRAPTLPEVRQQREAEAKKAELVENGLDEDEEEEQSLNALKPVWTFGVNRHIPVINLATSDRNIIFYVCANIAVLYDVDRNKQKILQGHTNAITCTASSADKRWLVSGDSGSDSAVIIWDSRTGVPVRTMFEPHPNGVAAVTLTMNARYLATLSAEVNQTFAIWDWTTGDDMPLCSATLSAQYGIQNYIYFNPDDHCHVATNSDSQVLFFQWHEGRVEYFAPPLNDKDFNKQVGKFSNTIYLRNSTKALTATSQGLGVVWDSNRPLTKVTTEATPDKKAVKLVPLHDKGITVLTQTDKYLVTGDSAGHVKFFDQNLQLLYWYQNFKFGPIASISFKYMPELDTDTKVIDQYDSDATIPAEHFLVHDFLIGTSTSVYASVDVKATSAKIIHKDFDAPVHGMDVHPKMERIAVGGFSGLLKIWNYREKRTECTREFEGGSKGSIRCLKYDPNGEYIAVGFNSGYLRFLDSTTLLDVIAKPFHYSRDAVTHIVFSDDGSLLATADGEFTTSLYRRGYGEGEPWLYVGRHRAHYSQIYDLIFGVHVDNGSHRLLSLGKDRFLVEYDISNASKDNLPILSSDRVEQASLPLCMAWYPPIVKEQFLLTANDSYKLKLYNSTTKVCRKTLLSPIYGSPIKKLLILPRPGAMPTDRRYMVFMIDDKVGLTLMPLDGNPHNSAAFIAHPLGVVNMAASYDGRYLFTAGGKDSTVQMWSVHTNVLEAQSALGGRDLTPFYGLLEGGRDGELFRELEDYFYYAQLRSQGIDSMDTRTVSERIPISEIPFVMRALGFYPSEQEIQDMVNEVKFSRYVDTGEYVTDLDIGDFIKLYVNHRPAFGLSLEKIYNAFETLGISKSHGAVIERDEMLDLLQNRGEHMTEYELAEYLTTLLGFNPEGGSFELEDFDTESAGEVIERNIPVDISAGHFAQDLLGFGPVPVPISRAPSSDAARPKSVHIQTNTG